MAYTIKDGACRFSGTVEGDFRTGYKVYVVDHKEHTETVFTGATLTGEILPAIQAKFGCAPIGLAREFYFHDGV
jgi:hypothetical protein